MYEKPRVKVYVGCHTEKGLPHKEQVPFCLGSESIALEIEGDFDIVYPKMKVSGDEKYPKDDEIVRNGKYSFCTCGRSRNMPYCDQTHQLVKHPLSSKKRPWDDMDVIHRLQTLLNSRENVKGISEEDRKVISSLNTNEELDVDIQDLIERVATTIDEDMLNTT